MRAAVLAVTGCALAFAACSSSSSSPPPPPAAAQCDATMMVADKKSCTAHGAACELPTPGGGPSACCICIAAQCGLLQYDCKVEANANNCPGSPPMQGDPCSIPDSVVCVYCAPTPEFVSCPSMGANMGMWTVSESAQCASDGGGGGG